MPDASDIQQALVPINDGIKRLEIQYERIINRIDALPNTYMTRNEYEPRHKSLEDDTKELREEFQQYKRDRVVLWLTIGGVIVSIGLHFLK